MYAAITGIHKEKLHQGDIIKDFPFLVFTQNKFNILNESPDPELYKIEKQTSLPANNKEQLVVFPIKLQKMIIISQTCDIENNDNILVAPIYSLKQIETDDRLSANNIKLLQNRRGRIKDWFYLPGKDDIMEEGFVDFQTIHYFPKALLSNYFNNRIAGLSDWGRHLLSWALSDFLGRPIEDKYRI